MLYSTHKNRRPKGGISIEHCKDLLALFTHDVQQKRKEIDYALTWLDYLYMADIDAYSDDVSLEVLKHELDEYFADANELVAVMHN